LDTRFFERIITVSIKEKRLVVKPKDRIFGDLEDFYPEDFTYVYYLDQEEFDYLIFLYKKHIKQRKDPDERIELFECTNEYGSTDWEAFDRILDQRRTS